MPEMPPRIVLLSMVCALVLIVSSLTILFYQNFQDRARHAPEIARLPIFHISDFMLAQLNLDVESMRQSGLLITDELDPLTAESDMIQDHVRIFLTVIVLLVIQQNTPEPFILLTNEDVWYYEDEKLREYLSMIYASPSASNIDLVIIPPHEGFGTFFVQQHRSKEEFQLTKNCTLRPFQSFSYKPRKKGTNPRSFCFAIRTSTILKKIFRCFPIVKPIEQTLYLHFNSYILDEQVQSRFENYKLSKSILAQSATSRQIYGTYGRNPLLMTSCLISPDRNRRIREMLYRNFGMSNRIPFFGFDPEKIEFILPFQFLIQNPTLPREEILLYLNFIFIFLRQSGNVQYVTIYMDEHLLSTGQSGASYYPLFDRALRTFIANNPTLQMDFLIFETLDIRRLQSGFLKALTPTSFPTQMPAILVSVERVFPYLFKLFPLETNLVTALNKNFNPHWI